MNVKFLLVVVLLAISSQVMAKAYRWVDEDGKTHYSDAPPPQVSDKVQEIKIDLPPPPASSPPVDSVDKSASTSGDSSGKDGRDAGKKTEEPKLADKCRKALQLSPKAMKKAMELLKEKYKSGKMSKEELEEAEKKFKSVKTPSQSECEAGYKTDASLRNVVDCFANADGDPETGLFCIAFVKAMDEAMSDIKAKEKQK